MIQIGKLSSFTRGCRVEDECGVLEAVVGELQAEAGHVRRRLAVAVLPFSVRRRRRSLLPHEDDLLVRGGPLQHERHARRSIRRLLAGKGAIQ